MSIKLCDDKYTFYEDEDGNLFCARYDTEQWRGFVGDKAVSALYRHRSLYLFSSTSLELIAMRESWCSITV